MAIDQTEPQREAVMLGVEMCIRFVLSVAQA